MRRMYSETQLRKIVQEEIAKQRAVEPAKASVKSVEKKSK